MRQRLSPDSIERLFQRTWKSRIRSIPAKKRQQMTIVTQNFHESDLMYYKLPKYKSWKWQSWPKIGLGMLINIWPGLAGSKKHDIIDSNFWCFFASLRLFRVRSFVGNLGFFQCYIDLPEILLQFLSLFILLWAKFCIFLPLFCQKLKESEFLRFFVQLKFLQEGLKTEAARNGSKYVPIYSVDWFHVPTFQNRVF